MCGILGAVAHSPVNQLLYDGLLLLQHRGQDAAGIVTSEGPVFHTYKGPGYVRDVFRTRKPFARIAARCTPRATNATSLPPLASFAPK